jgi:hypothetical protein
MRMEVRNWGDAKNISKDVDMMKYLKEVELEATWSTKERDWILQ